MQTYDIIIPHYGVGRLTNLCRRCLETIREHSLDYRVILVDNASPELALLVPELARHPHTLIRNTENLGFVKAVNQGLRVSDAPFIVIMNNDTEAVPGWLEALREPLRDDVALSGPLSTALGSWQGKWQIRGEDRYVVLPKKHMLAFFCTMLMAKVVKRVGLLDEDFGVGFGDDDDYCSRALKAGYRLALVQHIRIPHHHRSTFKALYTPQQIRAMGVENLAKFRAKAAAR